MQPQPYQIKPINRTCSGTGRDLEPGERVRSVLIERDGEFVRLDFGADAWQGPPENALAYWSSRVPEPEPKKAAGLDPDQMLSYFEQLVEDAIPAQDQLRYVLALFLLQKRRLRLDGSRSDGDIEYLQLSGTHGEGPYEIPDQQLSEVEIERLQAELDIGLRTEN